MVAKTGYVNLFTTVSQCNITLPCERDNFQLRFQLIILKFVMRIDIVT